MTPPSTETAVPVVRIQPTGGFLELNLRELWDYRELLYFLVWRDVKVRYKQAVIGVGWAILQPFLTMIVFSIFFGHLAKLPSGGLPYPIFYYSALLPWNYFAQALTGATNSMIENQRIITRIYFPRLILPLAAVLTGLVDFAIAFIILLAMLWWYGISPSPTLALLPIFGLLAVMTALGVGVWLAALNAVYRDVRYVIPFLLQFWLFASPVVYPSSLVPPHWQWVYGLNPMAGVIEGFRWGLTGQGRPPDLMLCATAGAVALILVGGLLYFQWMEETVVDVV